MTPWHNLLLLKSSSLPCDVKDFLQHKDRSHPSPLPPPLLHLTLPGGPIKVNTGHHGGQPPPDSSCLPACLPGGLPAWWYACLDGLPARLFYCLPACFPPSFPACLPACLPGGPWCVSNPLHQTSTQHYIYQLCVSLKLP